MVCHHLLLGVVADPFSCGSIRPAETAALAPLRLALSANLIIIFGIIGAYVIAGKDHIPYQYGHWYFFIAFIGHISFLARYSQRIGWPTWKLALVTITGGILHALLFMALGLRFCFWIDNSCP